MGKALFITGTGTDVGKTYVTGLIVKCLRDAGLSASYYKAALSGAETAEDGSLLPGDALYVRRIAGLTEPADELVSYVYRDAVSPHLAAKIEHRPMDFDKIERDFQRAKARTDYLTVEGSGGISQVPGLWVDQNLAHVADVEQRGGFPCVLVFRDDPGELHGQLPPGEIHQTTTQFLVQPVQRGGW